MKGAGLAGLAMAQKGRLLLLTWDNGRELGPLAALGLKRS